MEMLEILSSDTRRSEVETTDTRCMIYVIPVSNLVLSAISRIRLNGEPPTREDASVYRSPLNNALIVVVDSSVERQSGSKDCRRSDFRGEGYTTNGFSCLIFKLSFTNRTLTVTYSIHTGESRCS